MSFYITKKSNQDYTKKRWKKQKELKFDYHQYVDYSIISNRYCLYDSNTICKKESQLNLKRIYVIRSIIKDNVNMSKNCEIEKKYNNRNCQKSFRCCFKI